MRGHRAPETAPAAHSSRFCFRQERVICMSCLLPRTRCITTWWTGWPRQLRHTLRFHRLSESLAEHREEDWTRSQPGPRYHLHRVFLPGSCTLALLNPIHTKYEARYAKYRCPHAIAKFSSAFHCARLVACDLRSAADDSTLQENKSLMSQPAGLFWLSGCGRGAEDGALPSPTESSLGKSSRSYHRPRLSHP